MDRDFAQDGIFQHQMTTVAEYEREARQGWPAALDEIVNLKSRYEHCRQELAGLTNDYNRLVGVNRELERQNKLMQSKLGGEALF